MSTYTPQQFVENWRDTPLRERQTYQIHFIDVCRLVGHDAPNPSGVDARGNALAFDFGVKKETGDQGFADVFYEGRFAVEYKGAGKHADLQAALNQLKQYRENLNNPPLLVVCDIENWEIHTNFNNAPHVVYAFKHHEVLEPRVQRWLRAMFEEPQQLHPHRNTEQVTKDAASTFHGIAANMRQWEAAPERIAHFLTKLVFCLFAEDVGLLPITDSGRGILSEIVEQTHRKPSDFVFYATQLFEAMRDGGRVMFHDIRYFNGQLFDDVTVEELSLEALGELRKAASLDWSAVEPAIFGTLFERSLDPSKRAQLGAHYTSRDDILLIVEPVLMQPLRREWDAIKLEATPLRDKYDEALKTSNQRIIHNLQSQLLALRERMLHRLREVQVLDPACGSGNFLYVSLQLLMDMEKAVITDPIFAGLPLAFPGVHPRQMHGIEVNVIAHDLASIVAWIGWIQWRQNNGYLSFGKPILESLEGNILLMDAILAYGENGNPVEPEWPEADVIVGNPPFLGDKKMRGELGNNYVDDLREFYEGRVPGQADLVCYWFEKARMQLERRKVQRAGLLATNSIRGGANRDVLEHIKESGDIFMAWSDREWILEGAAVNVSMVGFDAGNETEKRLDGLPVATVNADLTATVDLTQAKRLGENIGIAFIGGMKKGLFDITQDLAQKMLTATNWSGRNNQDVLRRWMNGLDITRSPRDMWIIDFGIDTPESEAVLYEQPYQYVLQHVKPERDNVNNPLERSRWWIHGRSAPDMRKALNGLFRYIATARVAKHRLFIWVDGDILADGQLIAVARDDDYFFGVLHSRLHEVWSLRMGTSLEDRPRYTPTTTFETFPFPWQPGHEDTSNPAYQAIASAAKQLHEERHAWLNPPGVSGKALQERTLTNLYNALNVWRGVEKINVKPDAADFAPRLDDLHRALDMAVCDAYGWPHEILADDEDILRRVLELNLERARTDMESHYA